MDLSRANFSRFWAGPIIDRLLAPVLFAFVLIAAIELAAENYYHPTFWEKTSWIMRDPYRGEGFDRLIVMEKLSKLLKYEPDIISVGDSSGFFSLQPTIVNRYLGGKRYVNLSTGGNQAFDGFKAIAEFGLQRTPSIKHVVLYMHPLILPSPVALRAGGLSPILQDNLISLRSWLTPPSAGLSPYFKTALYEGRQFKRGEPLSNHKVALEFRSTVDLTLGWVPEHDIRFDRFRFKMPFRDDRRKDWLGLVPGVEKSTINYVLTDFAEMVESYGARLIVAFAPMPQVLIPASEPERDVARIELERFQKAHPNVGFLFPLLTTFGNEKFGNYNHVAREYTFLSSKRLGVALKRYLDDPHSTGEALVETELGHAQGVPEAEVVGSPSNDLRDAAMAFYQYTATSDPIYRHRISKRVLELLDGDKAFGFMMDDAKLKIDHMAGSSQKLGVSADQIVGTPVAVKNVAHCNNADPTLQWVRLSGAMIFTFEDPQRRSVEPVAWPAASNILVPTVLENGIRKFDGYCPEPSMAAFEAD